MKIPDWYSVYKDFIENSIEKYLKNYLDGNFSEALEEFKETIFYSVKGGKKLRAILALEFYLVSSGKNISDIKFEDDIVKICIAIELIHAFSLIHDDLPCMDNDELRRGEPTVWKKFGEYKAVLVGDLLNIICFEIISEISDSNLSKQISKLISRSTGFYGMLGGQVEDIFYEENFSKLDKQILLSLHNKKTGALIRASIVSGCILAGDNNLEKKGEFGTKLGLAFQLKDDILDVEGTAEEVGKSVGGEKKGFVYLEGLENSKNLLNELILNCRDLTFNLNSEKINFLIDYVALRKS